MTKTSSKSQPMCSKICYHTTPLPLSCFYCKTNCCSFLRYLLSPPGCFLRFSLGCTARTRSHPSFALSSPLLRPTLLFSSLLPRSDDVGSAQGHPDARALQRRFPGVYLGCVLPDTAIAGKARENDRRAAGESFHDILFPLCIYTWLLPHASLNQPALSL